MASRPKRARRVTPPKRTQAEILLERAKAQSRTREEGLEEEIRVQEQRRQQPTPNQRIRNAERTTSRVRAQLEREQRANRRLRRRRQTRAEAVALANDDTRPENWGGSRADKLAFVMRNQPHGQERVPRTIHDVRTPTGLLVSSNIQNIEPWEPHHGGYMIVQFHGGRRYGYWPVTQIEYENVRLGAERARTGRFEGKFPSIGAALHWRIKTRAGIHYEEL